MTAFLKDCVGNWFSATNPVKFYGSCSTAVQNNAVGSFFANQAAYFLGKKVAPVIVTSAAVITLPACGFIYCATKALQGGANIIEGYSCASKGMGSRVEEHIRHDSSKYVISPGPSDALIQQGVRRVCLGGAGATACALVSYGLYQVIISSW